MPVISNIKDQNIFHIFAFDILMHYDPKQTTAIINSRDLDLSNPCQKWRKFVMQKLYKNVEYSDDITGKSVVTHECYDCWKFIDYEPDSHIQIMYRNISQTSAGAYVLLNQRDLDDRYLYEYRTRTTLEEYLAGQDLILPVRTCNFGKMTPEEQYEACAGCALLISAHGAGCTNLIFTSPNTPLLEISFRKHWYCDPVCDDHFEGVISINEKCDGELTYRPYYHKADYHNLCRLIDKPYCEIEPVDYGEGFNKRNPIWRKQIYVDGNRVVEYINGLDVAVR